MERSATVPELKALLLTEVNSLFKQDGRLWKKPIVQMLRDLQKSRARAVFFGGTLRSLLVSRLYRGLPGRPRDLDLVVSGIPFEDIESRFNGLVARRNRFGGLQLKRDGWQFDVWPVGSTWALQKDGLGDAGFSALPSTTPFNLEAIAVDAWPYAARSRELFSGDDQFFEGVLSRTLELNRTDNPFPALTVVRALVLSAELGFRIGPKLVEYIASEGLALGADELEQLQQQHYGHTRIGGRTLRALATSIGQQSGRAGSIDAPVIGQLPLWREEEAVSRLQVYYVGSQFRSPADRRIDSIAPRTEKVNGQHDVPPSSVALRFRVRG